MIGKLIEGIKYSALQEEKKTKSSNTLCLPQKKFENSNLSAEI